MHWSCDAVSEKCKDSLQRMLTNLPILPLCTAGHFQSNKSAKILGGISSSLNANIWRFFDQFS